jgi:hypothetical protein
LIALTHFHKVLHDDVSCTRDKNDAAKALLRAAGLDEKKKNIEAGQKQLHEMTPAELYQMTLDVTPLTEPGDRKEKDAK